MYKIVKDHNLFIKKLAKKRGEGSRGHTTVFAQCRLANISPPPARSRHPPPSISANYCESENTLKFSLHSPLGDTRAPMESHHQKVTPKGLICFRRRIPVCCSAPAWVWALANCHRDTFRQIVGLGAGFRSDKALHPMSLTLAK